MKKILLTMLMAVMAMSAFAQNVADAYICDLSGTPTNIRDAPNGKIVQTLKDVDGGYVVTLLETKNNWWKIDPEVDIYGDVEEGEDVVKLKGSKTGYWIHYSVLQFTIAGEREDVIRTKPSSKAAPVKFTEPSYLAEIELRPLEILGEWIKVITVDRRYTGWMPIGSICSNPLTTCP